MLITILLGILVIELGIIAWNTRKKKIRTIKIPEVKIKQEPKFL